LKSRYFGAKKNKDSLPDDLDNEYEVFEIEDVMNDRQVKRKKKLIAGSKISVDFNPFNQGKVQLHKKRKKGEEEVEDSEEVNKTGQNDEGMQIDIKDETEYIKQKQYFEKMLMEETKDNTNINANTKDLNKQIFVDQKKDDDTNNRNVDNNRVINFNHEEYQENCTLCKSASYIDSKIRLKKKENPCLLEPQEIK
jgi:hypothetical protein